MGKPRGGGRVKNGRGGCGVGSNCMGSCFFVEVESCRQKLGAQVVCRLWIMLNAFFASSVDLFTCPFDSSLRSKALMSGCVRFGGCSVCCFFRSAAVALLPLFLPWTPPSLPVRKKTFFENILFMSNKCCTFVVTKIKLLFNTKHSISWK